LEDRGLAEIEAVPSAWLPLEHDFTGPSKAAASVAQAADVGSGRPRPAGVVDIEP
jgi:hypothetical protein